MVVLEYHQTAAVIYVVISFWLEGCKAQGFEGNFGPQVGPFCAPLLSSGGLVFTALLTGSAFCRAFTDLVFLLFC